MELGANTDVQTDDGETPLYVAADQGHVVMVRVLVGLGADMDVKSNYDDFTPLHAAAVLGRVEMVSALAELGADLDVKTASGHTALELSLQRGLHQVSQRLRELQRTRQSSASQASTCAACGSNRGSSRRGTLQTCSRCMQVKYCSVPCQRNHWRTHKASCAAAAAAAAESSIAVVEAEKKGKDKAIAGQDGAGGSSSKTPAGSSGQGSSSQQAGGQRSTVADVAPSSLQLPALPPNPTCGTPQEMQAARKERQRVRKIREAMLREASEAQK